MFQAALPIAHIYLRSLISCILSLLPRCFNNSITCFLRKSSLPYLKDNPPVNGFMARFIHFRQTYTSFLKFHGNMVGNINLLAGTQYWPLEITVVIITCHYSIKLRVDCPLHFNLYDALKLWECWNTGLLDGFLVCRLSFLLKETYFLGKR